MRAMLQRLSDVSFASAEPGDRVTTYGRRVGVPDIAVIFAFGPSSGAGSGSILNAANALRNRGKICLMRTSTN